MEPFKLSSEVIIFEHKDYGTRLLFKNGPTNPRDKLGKLGVSFHSKTASLSRHTIPIAARILNEQGENKEGVFYLNRNSLIKYLGTKAPSNPTDGELLVALETLLNNAPMQEGQIVAPKPGIRHAGKFNRIQLNGWFRNRMDSLRASFLGWLYRVTISSVRRLWMRFVFLRSEQDIFEAGAILAKQRFQETSESVPAYKKHLQDKLDPAGITDFASIPPTDKESYIKAQEYDSDTHIHGKYPKHSKTDTSTGTTGKPTPWVRSAEELTMVQQSLALAGKIQFGKRRLHYINAFAFGPWATGLTTYELMRKTGSVFPAGPDKEKIFAKLLEIKKYEEHRLAGAIDAFAKRHPSLLDNRKRCLHKTIADILHTLLTEKTHPLRQEVFKRFYGVKPDGVYLIQRYADEIIAIVEELNAEKEQVIIAGYPPFLQDLALYIARQGHSMKDFSCIGIVGGQAISEAMRDALKYQGFAKIYSSYGASDLDINLGVESDYEITVRKTIEQHPELAKEFLGENLGLPMVFHYDPMNYHVEVSPTSDLIFTCTREDRSSPRIRYNLGDKGRVIAASDIQAGLAKYGVFQKPRTNLPLMFVWGRDSTVIFRGANLAFTELERAVTEHPTLKNNVLKKAFYSYQDARGAEQLEIWLELHENMPLPSEDEARGETATLLNYLVEHNQDLRWQVEQLNDGDSLPKVRFFMRGQSPISEAGGHRKQVLIFQKGVNLAQDYQFPSADQCLSVQLSKNEMMQQEEPVLVLN